MSRNPRVVHIGIYSRGGTWDFVANKIYENGGGSFPIASGATPQEVCNRVREFYPEHNNLAVIYHPLHGQQILSEPIAEASDAEL